MRHTYSRISARGGLSQQHGKALSPRSAWHYEKPNIRPRKITRGLQRIWGCSLVGVALLLLFGQAPAVAATIVVNEGQCALDRAIASANNDASRYCAPGQGPDTIVLPRNRQLVLGGINNTLFGPTALPVVRTPITIIGNGSTIVRRPGAANFRIFAVARSGRLTLKDLTIRGGFAARLGGGAIRSLGFLTLIDVVLDNNHSAGNGGGFWAANNVTVVDSSILQNRSFCPPPSLSAACNGGGGFYVPGQITAGQVVLPSLTINGSTINGNRAGEQGGGLQINGDATINDSTLAGNAAQQGGAIAVGTILADIINDSLRTSNAPQSLVAMQSAQIGSVELNNTTVTGNVATERGGGIIIGEGSSVTLSNTVVSGNSAPEGREAVAQPGSFVDADNFNTIGFGGDPGVVGFEPGPTDIVDSQSPEDATSGESPAPGVVAPPTPPESGSGLPPDDGAPSDNDLLPGGGSPPATGVPPETGNEPDNGAPTNNVRPPETTPSDEDSTPGNGSQLDNGEPLDDGVPPPNRPPSDRGSPPLSGRPPVSDGPPSGGGPSPDAGNNLG